MEAFDPTKRLTPGQFRTTCQVSSTRSISTMMYVGKNFRVDCVFFPFFISVTTCVGTRMRPNRSSMPDVAIARSRLPFTLFS